MSYNNHINQSGVESKPEKADEIDGVDEVTAYMELIKENIEYEYHMQYDDCENTERGDCYYSRRVFVYSK